MNSELYVIAGATASGKTAVAVELAKRLNGEVISADSMQVYQGMDIGTAKPTAEEMDGVPHHLIDIIPPNHPFSVADFQQRAIDAIRDIKARGKMPILAGGTGFYINAVIYGAEFPGMDSEDKLRQAYTDLANEKGALFLHEKLQQADPAAAEAIHPNNIKRVARALSYCETTGELFSAHNAAQKARKPLFNAHFCVLDMPREALYNRINQRTLAMWEAGLPDEVQNLLSQGFDIGLAPMQGIGYKETVQFIQGKYTQAETIANIQQATRNYAKRQITWFRNQSQNARQINADSKTPNVLAREAETSHGA